MSTKSTITLVLVVSVIMFGIVLYVVLSVNSPKKESTLVFEDVQQAVVPKSSTDVARRAFVDNSLPPISDVEFDMSNDELFTDLLKDISLDIEEKAKMEMHLNDVLKYDREIYGDDDLKEEEIENASTEELCAYICESGLRVLFGMYDNPNIGITRAVRVSKTVKAFIDRDDIAPAMIRLFDNRELDPEKIENSNIGRMSLSLMAIDELLMYPYVLEKTKGYEGELIQSLARRLRKMVEVNKSYEKKYGVKDTPYSASLSTCIDLIFSLSDQQGTNLKQQLLGKDIGGVLEALEKE